MKLVAFAMLLLSIAVPLRAQSSAPGNEGGTVQNTVRVGNRIYHNARITAFGKRTVEIESSLGGPATVPIYALPPDMKAEALAWIDKQKAEEDARAKEETEKQANKGSDRIRGDVLRVTKGGVIVTADAGSVFVKGFPGTPVRGDHVDLWGKPDGTFLYKTNLGSSASLRAYKYLHPAN